MKLTCFYIFEPDFGLFLQSKFLNSALVLMYIFKGKHFTLGVFVPKVGHSIDHTSRTPAEQRRPVATPDVMLLRSKSLRLLNSSCPFWGRWHDDFFIRGVKTCEIDMFLHF